MIDGINERRRYRKCVLISHKERISFWERIYLYINRKWYNKIESGCKKELHELFVLKYLDKKCRVTEIGDLYIKGYIIPDDEKWQISQLKSNRAYIISTVSLVISMMELIREFLFQ